MTVKNTFIANNDDCIASKGSKGVDAMEDRDSPPVEHIRVSNCTFAMGGSLITCGSEATIVRDVVVEHCTVAGPESASIDVLHLKLRTDTPQLYEDIHLTTSPSTAPARSSMCRRGRNTKPSPPAMRALFTLSATFPSRIKGTFGSFGSVCPNPGDTFEKWNFENLDLRFTSKPTPDLAAVK